MSYALFDVMLASLREELYNARGKVLTTNGARRANVSWNELANAKWKVTWIDYMAVVINAKVKSSLCCPLALVAIWVS